MQSQPANLFITLHCRLENGTRSGRYGTVEPAYKRLTMDLRIDLKRKQLAQAQIQIGEDIVPGPPAPRISHTYN